MTMFSNTDSFFAIFLSEIITRANAMPPNFDSQVGQQHDKYHHHHHIYSPIITSSQQYHKNSHTIGGLPEKP